MSLMFQLGQEDLNYVQDALHMILIVLGPAHVDPLLHLLLFTLPGHILFLDPRKNERKKGKKRLRLFYFFFEIRKLESDREGFKFA